MSTQVEIGDHLDMSDRNVRDLIKRGVLPPSRGHGGLDKDECRVAYIRYLRGLASGQTTERVGDLDPAQERARKDRALADKAELQVRQIRQELVLWTAVQASWEKMLGRLRSRLLNLPAKMAPLIQASDGKYETVRRIAEERIYEAMQELSEDPGDEIADTPADVQGADAPAKADGKRVGRRKQKAKSRGKRRTRPVEH